MSAAAHDDYSRTGGVANDGTNYSRTTAGANDGAGYNHAGYNGAGFNRTAAGANDGVGGGSGATVFLRPIAAPSALGMAAYAGSTWIVASWLASWWGGVDSPIYFFPFVLFWGGLAQFMAGYKGFHSRDNLVLVFHTLWGSFYLAAGLLWLLTAAGAIPLHNLRTHFPEFASWAVVLMVFSWICTAGAFARDMVLFGTLLTASLGSTLGVGGWYSSGSRASATVKAAAYILMISSALAAYRVAAFIFEENFGRSILPVFRTRRERATQAIQHGYGEPGVKRGEPNSPVESATGVNTHSKGGLGRKARPSGDTTV